MTPDQLRRAIRMELHAVRCHDVDQSPERYYNDARELDRRMAEAGYEVKHPTTWSAGHAQEAKRPISRMESASQHSGEAEYQADLAEAGV